LHKQNKIPVQQKATQKAKEPETKEEQNLHIDKNGGIHLGQPNN